MVAPICSGLICLLALCGSPASRAAEREPEQVVRDLADQAVAVLRDQSLSTDQKRSKLENLAHANMDFYTLSRLVLARNWRRLSKAQQGEFVEEFKRHLSVTYGDRINDYKNESVRVIGERKEPRGDYTVQTKILRGGPGDVEVDYRLRRRDEQWKIIDVIVEGVSLVANFRSQFQEIMANGGPDKLLRLLREKNERGEPLKS
jgi:phospholipid transport system substrate-binding protein